MSTKVMVNGLPGNMAKEVITSALNRGLEVVPYSLTGAGVDIKSVEVQGVEVELVTPDVRDEKIKAIKEQYAPFVSIDYTHPTAVNANGEFYVANELPFVMGTTGGDRAKLDSDVRTAELYAVIAPNMAKQIVALQAMLEWGQENFPTVYNGYSLSVVESHQKTKADTSGTAKAIVDTLNGMGIPPIEHSDIEKVRVEDEMMSRMDVPEEYLSGHAFHTYRLTSDDGTVAFEYRHNVCGRSIYAEGTIDASIFLADEIASPKTDKKLFTMIDVLQQGAMN